MVGVSGDRVAAGVGRGASPPAVGGEATINRSQLYYLDVTHPQANKGDGVNALCQRIGVDLARTAVIGDMFNDVAMFAEAGFSIAMGQSPTAVKQRAAGLSPRRTPRRVSRGRWNSWSCPKPPGRRAEAIAPVADLAS